MPLYFNEPILICENWHRVVEEFLRIPDADANTRLLSVSDAPRCSSLYPDANTRLLSVSDDGATL